MTQTLRTLRSWSFRDELERRRRVLREELRSRTRWFIRLRWIVPPVMIIGGLVATLLGFTFSWTAVSALAVAVLVYNAVFAYWSKSLDTARGVKLPRRLTYAQVFADFAAIGLLAYTTGGAASPFLFFFVFHILFASILIPNRWAYIFAGLASAGTALLAVAQYHRQIESVGLLYQGRNIIPSGEPIYVAVELGFFAASLFIVAFFSASIQKRLRKRIYDLSALSEWVIAINRRLERLYGMMEIIGTERDIDRLLKAAAAQMASVMEVKGVSIKLVSDDGKYLDYRASYGLPDALLENKRIEVDKSTVNRRILQGEAFVAGNITERDLFQFGEDLADASFRSVLFVPLAIESRVVGILGVYSSNEERFAQSDVEFLKIAAGYLAINIENARAYYSVKVLSDERTWMTTKVTHNLRAPLAAMIGMVEVLRGGYIAPVDPHVDEYLRRIERRAHTMVELIGEVLQLADNRAKLESPEFTNVDLHKLAGRIGRTFSDQAIQRGLTLTIDVPDNLPAISGNEEQLERLLENLISNAVKYTPGQGEVNVDFCLTEDACIRITVADTGIGIPAEAQPRLFREFFRADNAKEIEEVGTGLGLSIVREIVNQHDGTIRVDSEQGHGTRFEIKLPVQRKESNHGIGATN